MTKPGVEPDGGRWAITWAVIAVVVLVLVLLVL
jgi:hypothetical protein